MRSTSQRSNCLLRSTAHWPRRRRPDPPRDAQHAIAEHACQKYSGRVGRSAAAKELDVKAVELAVRAHVRHAHTPYDRLLAQGADRGEARREVASRVEGVLERWASTE